MPVTTRWSHFSCGWMVSDQRNPLLVELERPYRYKIVSDLVECRSEGHYAERPTALYWQNERFVILEILARWRTPHGRGFRVRVGGDRVFELFYDEALDNWLVEERPNQAAE